MKQGYRRSIVILAVMSLTFFGSVAYACECPNEPQPENSNSPSNSNSNSNETPTTPTPVIVEVFTAPYVAPNMEDNLSFNDSNVGVVLYKTQDEAGNTQLDVYDVKNEGTNSSYLFSITQEDLAPFASENPTENTMLASNEKGDISVYILTTGEIQINAGPDWEGKMHIKILDGIPWTKIYGYTVDPE